MASVGFKNVVKIFDGNVRAIDNVSLDIEDGEFAVLVGPSGCGKSTLIRMLAGLSSPTSGDILIDGRVVNKESPKERNTAMVFQNYALYPHMTVRQNLAFPLKMRSTQTQEIATEIKRVSEMLELGLLLDRKPKQLSGGQRQRVAMGRALVRRPAVFLMDEPLSNLDARLRSQIRTDIAALQRRLCTTTIYVTHDQVEAMTLGHRVFVLKDGAVRQTGEPKEIYDKPADTFVAVFFGNPGMNLLPAKARFEKEGELKIALGTETIKLRVEHAALPPPKFDGPLLVGLRPESLTIIGNSGQTSHLELVVKATELIGHEQLIYFDPPQKDRGESEETADDMDKANGTTKLVARMSSALKLSPGEKVPVCFQTGYLHLFHKSEKGRRLGSFSLSTCF